MPDATPLTLTPQEAALTSNQVARFTLPGIDPATITWSITPEAPGVFHAGVFVAPPTIDAPSVHTITATVDGRVATSLLRLVAISVQITPTSVELRVDEQQQFAAFVTGDPTNAITWTITPTVGVITNGLYTPPCGYLHTQKVEVRATSTIDPTRDDTAELTLVPPKPMPNPTRIAFGSGLAILCVALCALTIAYWPLSTLDPKRAAREQETAQQTLREKVAVARTASQSLQAATQAADARNPREPALDAAVTKAKEAAATADNEVNTATKDVADKTLALKNAEESTVNVLLVGSMPRELNYLLLVLLMGALGSFIHTAKSFIGFAGNRSLVASWSWWYVLQPLIGTTLALLFYVIVRAGFFATGAGPTAVSTFGVAAVSGMVGMFSKQASDKLCELFSTLFKTSEDAQRKDKMSQPSTSAKTAEASAAAAATR